MAILDEELTEFVGKNYLGDVQAFLTLEFFTKILPYVFNLALLQGSCGGGQWPSPLNPLSFDG